MKNLSEVPFSFILDNLFFNPSVFGDIPDEPEYPTEGWVTTLGELKSERAKTVYKVGMLLFRDYYEFFIATGPLVYGKKLSKDELKATVRQSFRHTRAFHTRNAALVEMFWGLVEDEFPPLDHNPPEDGNLKRFLTIGKGWLVGRVIHHDNIGTFPADRWRMQWRPWY